MLDQPFPQRGIHTHLPARTFGAEGRQHIVVEANRHLLLASAASRAARVPLGNLFAHGRACIRRVAVNRRLHARGGIMPDAR